MRFFCEDITASKTAILLKIDGNTINHRYFNQFRFLRAAVAYNEGSLISGDIAFDASYFGVQRIRGKRGRGDAGETPVLGVLKRDENVYVKTCSKERLMSIIQRKVLEGSTVYGWIRA